MTLSIGILAYNSQSWIEQCVSCMLPYAQEVIVGVDDKTNDVTKFLLEKMKIPFYEFTWKHDYAFAKNKLLDHLSGDWIMILDDDEKLSPEGAKKLFDLISFCDLEGYDGIELGMKQHYPIWTTDENDYLKEFYPNTHMQVFRRNPEYAYISKVHEGVSGIPQEKIYTFPKTEQLGIFIHHHAWKGNREKFEAPKHFYYKNLSEGKVFQDGEHQW